jgi:drug/metabolite transporter (DMT)-like permease
VPILDFLTGRRLKQREILGVVLAVLGVGILELGGTGQHATAFTQGDLLSFIQPLAFGMGFWRMEHAMKNFPEHANRSTAAQLLAVFASSALYGTFAGNPYTSLDLSNWLQDPQILFALFWTGCITTALTVYMETLALKTLSAAETTLIFSTEPIWGAACASVIVGEVLGPESLIGGALILGGCLISNLDLSDANAIFSLSFLQTSLASIGFASQKAYAVADLFEKDTLDVLEDIVQGASDGL